MEEQGKEVKITETFSAIPKIVSQTNKTPWAVLFIAVLLAGGVFFWLYTKEVDKNIESKQQIIDSQNEQLKTCADEMEAERQQKNEYQKQRDELYNKLLFKSGYSDEKK